jgi:hypothetical protein
VEKVTLYTTSLVDWHFKLLASPLASCNPKAAIRVNVTTTSRRWLLLLLITEVMTFYVNLHHLMSRRCGDRQTTEMLFALGHKVHSQERGAS